jgi:hypothetical protein
MFSIMNMLEKEGYALFTDGRRLEPASLDKNMVGFCGKCESELESLAYHRSEDIWLISARCKNDHIVLILYDSEWNWLGDQSLEIAAKMPIPAEQGSISNIPREKLEAVFTHAEIRDMIAHERNQPYTRQNLYRAKAKFEKFEKLFGMRIKLR